MRQLWHPARHGGDLPGWASVICPVSTARAIRRTLLCSTGHKGKFGHEFMEFEIRPDGRLRYANNSNYKNDTMIRKEVRISPGVLAEVKRIVQESEILE